MGSSLRSHLRAPLYRDVLYLDEGHVLKCFGANVSEGGILLGLFPHVPNINLMPLLVEIPRYPLFSQMDKDEICHLKADTIPSEIVRMRGKIVRSFEGKSDIDKIFIQNIGCQFIDTDIAKKIIPDYINIFTANIVFLLGLFENSHRQEEQIAVIRNISNILGHKKDESLSILRQKILHDYQSLKSN